MTGSGLAAALMAAPARADTVTLTVEDSVTSAPIRFAAVTYGDLRTAAATDDSGALVIDAPGGSTTATVAAPGYAAQTVPVGPGDTHVALVADGGLAMQDIYGFPIYNAVMTADRGASGVFYAASAYGTSIWRTGDAGRSWGPVTTEAMDPEHGLKGEAHYTGQVIATSGVPGEVAAASTIRRENGSQCLAISASRDFGATWRNVPLPGDCPAGIPSVYWAHSGSPAKSVLVARMGTELYLADMTQDDPVFVMDPGFAPGPDDQVAVGSPTSGPFLAVAPSGDGRLTDHFQVRDLDAGGVGPATDIPLGSSIEVSAGTFPFRVGGTDDSVIVLGDGEAWAGGNDHTDEIALVARAAAGDWSTARAGVFRTGTCYAHEVAVAPVGDATAGVRGVSAGCAFTATPSATDGEWDFSASAADLGLRFAYSAGYDGSGTTDLLSLSFTGGSRGVQRFRGAGTAEQHYQPIDPTDATDGIRDTLVTSTGTGPDGESWVSLSPSGGRQVLASDAGQWHHVLRYHGADAMDWWHGATGTWLGTSRTGVPLSLISDWTTSDGPADSLSGNYPTDPNVTDLTATDIEPDHQYTGADVTAIAGVTGRDTAFLGTFAGTGAAAYGGRVFVGEIGTGGHHVGLTELAMPSGATAKVTDIAYCPAAGSDATVADTVFVSTGYQGWAPGGLYLAHNVLARVDAHQPVTLQRVAGINDARDNVVVPQVSVDCAGGFAASVEPDSHEAVVSDDAFATLEPVALPDADDQTPGDQPPAIDKVDVGAAGEVLLGGDGPVPGFVYDVDLLLSDPLAEQTPDIVEVHDPVTSDLPLELSDLDLKPPDPPVASAQRRSRRAQVAAQQVVQESPAVRLGAIGTLSGSFTLSGRRAHAPDDGPNATPPSAPTGVSAIAGNARITVRWNESADGGSPITGYTATAAPGGRTCSVGAAARSCVITGLTNGTSYRATVRAVNLRGTSPASTQSNAVTPALPTTTVVLSRPTTGVMRATLGQARPGGGAWNVQLQRRVNNAWSTVVTKPTAAGGRTVEFGYRPSGQYRAFVAAQSGYGATSSAPLTYVAAQASLRTTVVVGGGAFVVDVDPNLPGAGSWQVAVQRWTGTRWAAVKNVATTGAREIVNVDLAKGRYRAVVADQRGYLGATGVAVTLTR
ncbi:MAG: fibronectin type III domain-containing protein [Candidatus Nanopelagicales bacterium]